jgi:hypothetical protein
VSTLLYDRYYRLVLGTKEIKGLRCAFNVTKTLTPTPNKAEITVYNLAEETIASLEQQVTFPVQLDAGYQDGSQTLFFGDLRASDTVYESDGSRVTTIKSGDGEKALRSKRADASLPKGTSADAVLRLVASSIGVLPGNLDKAVSLVKSKFGGKNPFPFGTTVAGNAARELTALCRTFDLEWSVQNGALQFTERNKVLEGQAIFLSGATGMVGFPSVDSKGVLLVSSLLNPAISPGRLLVLDSVRLKGSYRITECSYQCDTHGSSNWTVAVKATRY